MCTPLVTWPIGTSGSGTSGQRLRHILRDTSPCSSLTPLARPAVRSASTVMLNCGPHGCSQRPKVMKRVAIESQPPPVLLKKRSISSKGKASLPAGTGVWVVNSALARTAHSAASNGSPSSSHQLAHALELEERGMPFVHVPDRRLQTQRPQHPHPADAQHHLLRDAHLLVAAVQPGRQLPIGGRVLLDVGVHQVERDAAHLDAPHLGVDRAPRQVDADDDALAVRSNAGVAGTSAKSSFS